MIFVIGGLNFDIFAQSKNLILSLNDESSKETNAQIDLYFGGQGGNIAIFSKYLGSSVKLFSVIGDDIFAKLYLQRLKRFDIPLKIKKIKNEKTGKVLIIKDENRYKMIRDKEISKFLDKDFLKESFEDILKKLKEGTGDSKNVVIIVSYALTQEGNLEVTREFLKPLKEKGAFIAVDTSSNEALRLIGKERFLKYLGKNSNEIGIDFVFPNFEEGKLLTGKQKKEEVIDFLSSYFDGIVLKMGGEGIYGFYKNEKCKIPVNKVEVVDETGAGDGVIASFFHYFLKDRNFRQSLELANKFASSVILYKGAQGIVE